MSVCSPLVESLWPPSLQSHRYVQREALQVSDEILALLNVMAKLPWALGGQGSLSGVWCGQEYVACVC